MRIRMTQAVEDSNEFSIAELADFEPTTQFTVSQKPVEAAGEVVALRRVDKLPAGLEIDLPPRQAENLVTLGYAEAL